MLALKEVAEYLRFTERTIYRMVADRKIPAFKVGGSWRFRLVEFDSWIKDRTHAVDSTSEGDGQ